MSKNKVSVIVPNYNYAHFLRQCLDSVIAQTYTNWELIVVDDNSSDNSREIVREYIKKYPNHSIRLLHNPNGPSGTPTPVNIGIRDMKGEYFSWLSSDDVFHPKKLEEQVNVLDQRPEVALVFTAFDIIDDNGVVTHMSFPDYNTYSKGEFILASLRQNQINGNTVLVRKSIFDSVGLFDEGWEECPRIWMVSEVLKWIEIAAESNIYFIEEKLHKARVHSAKKPGYESNIFHTLSGMAAEKFLATNDRIRLYENLNVKTVDEVRCFEMRIAGILTYYGRTAYLMRRLADIREQDLPLYHAIIDCLNGREYLAMVARVAHLILLKTSDPAELAAYRIERDYFYCLDISDLYTIGSVLKRAKEFERAEAIFNHLLLRSSLKGSDFESGVYFHLGEIYLAQRKQLEAMDVLHSCIQINPCHKKAQEYITHLLQC